MRFDFTGRYRFDHRLNVVTLKGTNIMFEYIKTWAALRTDRRAVTALEYAMIAGIVVAVIAVGFGVLAGDLTGKFSSIGTSL